MIDPTIVARKRRHGPLDDLSDREREVLVLLAEGRSNSAIGAKVFVSRKTVDSHISQIFHKLGMRKSPDQNRCVLAVLTFLGTQKYAGEDHGCARVYGSSSR